MSEQQIRLVMDEGVKARLNRQLLLEDEVKEIIGYAEENQRYVYDADTGERIAHRQSGYITIWVRYRPLDEQAGARQESAGQQSGQREHDPAYRLLGAYFHRMKIKGEEHGGE